MKAAVGLYVTRVRAAPQPRCLSSLQLEKLDLFAFSTLWPVECVEHQGFNNTKSQSPTKSCFRLKS
jgi:hypothetical protein